MQTRRMKLTAVLTILFGTLRLACSSADVPSADTPPYDGTLYFSHDFVSPEDLSYFDRYEEVGKVANSGANGVLYGFAGLMATLLQSTNQVGTLGRYRGWGTLMVGVCSPGRTAVLALSGRLLLRKHRTQPGTLDGDFWNIRVRRLMERFPNKFGDGQHAYTAPTD